MKRIFYTLLVCANFCFSSLNAQVRNVILMIGDGMGLVQIQAAYTANHGFLNMLQSSNIGISKTTSANKYITDSAAGATAFSTGQKTINGYTASDTTGKPLKTILEIAEEHGYATGMVTTCEVTHATPAAFIAHWTDRYSYEDIAKEYLKTDIDVFMGGGKKEFCDRKDGQDLITKLEEHGYHISLTLEDAEQVKHGKIAGFFEYTDLPRMSEDRGDMLSRELKIALSILKQNKKGFFLMVEGSQIDWGNHKNEKDYTIDETIDFDHVVGDAIEFAKKDKHTLVIVLADHASGGMSIVGGNIKDGYVEARYSTKQHDGMMVPVFAFGEKAEMFRGVYENTEIFYKMMKAFGFKK